MQLIDSCGWLEYITDGPLADKYAAFIESNRNQFLVPTLIVYEVYKFLRRTTTEEMALQAVAHLETCQTIGLDLTLAMEAADRSILHQLAMADAIVYATSQHYKAELVTSDADFKNLPGVHFITK
ncbi:MAG TPA: type II toxin-antitoxin system VapC family toxin [Gammaproteobacteria bacterium]|nr:type II toxin-antitoxin system VapC family toxin [Gammaproteobacteria bacterium]